MSGILITLVGILVNETHISETIHQEADFGLFHLLLLINSFLCVFNGSLTLTAVFLLDLIQFTHDHCCHGVIIIQDILISSNVLHGFLMLLHQSIDLQTDQLVKTHVQDSCGLFFCEFQGFCRLFGCLGLEFNPFCDTVGQTFLYLVTALAATEDLDDQINDIAGFDKAFLDLPFLLFLGKKGCIFSGIYFKYKVHMVSNDLLQSQCFRSSVCNCQHVDTEGILQSGLLIEHVGKVLHVCIALQFQNDTDSLLGRLVGNIHDICGLLGLYQGCDIIKEFSDVCTDHGVRNLCDHQLLATALQLLYFHPSTDTELTCSGFIDLYKVVLIYYDTTCRKIRALEITHQPTGADIIILHVCLHSIHHFAQVMRRDAGSHTNGDSVCSVYKEVWNTHRKYYRLLLCFIKVRHKVHNVLIKVFQKNLLGQLLQTGLCVSHGCGSVSLDGTKVSMSVHQCTALLKFLRHDYKRIINGAVTVGMIFTHGISYDTGTFTVRAVVADAKLIHIVKGTALYRLQSVTYIRQCSGNDNAHGVIDI